MKVWVVHNYWDYADQELDSLWDSEWGAKQRVDALNRHWVKAEKVRWHKLGYQVGQHALEGIKADVERSITYTAEEMNLSLTGGRDD